MKPTKPHRICSWLLVALTVLCSGLTIQAASFINLDFEAAHVPVIPIGPFGYGEFGTNETVGKALPGWSAFIGVHPITSVLHNNLSFGDPSIAIWGPTSFSQNVISGQFSAYLKPGDNENAPADDVGASISQTAVIPSGALSILFKTRYAPPGTFGLFADSNSLSLVPMFAGDIYTQYGADISSYAGRNTELKFSSFFIPFAYNVLVLDDISFSTNPIPEPSTAGLVALAGFLWLGFQHRRRAIRRG